MGWTDEALATSWGLTQVLGATAWAELGFHEPPRAILDPVKNLKLGAHYLKKKFKKWGNVYEALLAYNGGDGAFYAYRAGNCYNCQYADNVLAIQKRIERGEPV